MNRYLRAISSNLIFFVLNTTFLFVSIPFAVRIMGEEFYGLWIVLKSILMVGGIGSASLGTVVMKFSSEAPDGEDADMQANRVMSSAYIIAISISLLMASILVLMRGVINSAIGVSSVYQEQLAKTIPWVAFAIFPYSMSFIPLGFLLSRLDHWRARLLEFSYSCSGLVGVIIISIIEKNLVWIGIWLLGVYCLYYCSLFLRERELKPFRFIRHSTTQKRVCNFFGFMALQSVAINFFQQFDKILVGFLLSPALAGVYSIGTSLGLSLSLITGQATEVMVPYASLKETSGARPQLYISFRRLSRYVSWVLALISGLLLIWMPEFLYLWISPQYSQRYAQPFRILIFAYMLLSLCRPGHQTLIGMGKVKVASLVYILTTVLMIGGLIVFSHFFGLLGAVSANLLMVFLLFYNLYIYKMLGPPYFWVEALRDLGVGVVLTVSIFILVIFIPFSPLWMKLLTSFTLVSFIVVVFWRDRDFLQLMGSMFTRNSRI